MLTGIIFLAKTLLVINPVREIFFNSSLVFTAAYKIILRVKKFTVNYYCEGQ